MRKRKKVPASQKQNGEIAGVLIGEMKFSKDEATAIIRDGVGVGTLT